MAYRVMGDEEVISIVSYQLLLTDNQSERPYTAGLCLAVLMQM